MNLTDLQRFPKIPSIACKFIAALIYSSWHAIPFSKLARYPTQELETFVQFVIKLVVTSRISPAVLFLAANYTLRIKAMAIQNCASTPLKGSEYRLFTGAMIIATKVLTDKPYTNKAWSSLAHIPVSELNRVEGQIMAQLSFDLNLSEQQYLDWVNQINIVFQEFVSLQRRAALSPINTVIDASSYGYSLISSPPIKV